jgi:tRNA-2-methylthio-N6-dimethylallyladenosine synthase
MATYHVWTVGCQMNKADSERLTSGLEQMGMAACEDAEEADVVVLNTCVVRQSAEDTATGMLSRLRPVMEQHPDRVLAVMGCMVGPRDEELRRRFPQVDVWARPQQFDPIFVEVGGALGIDPEGCVGSLVPAAPSVTSYVPIIHGCDKFCTFCIIPYRRGREVSRPITEVVHELALLVGRGVKEVTLLGQNVDSYGHDLEPSQDLADLLYAVHDVEGLERIRFLTSHPSDMSTRIIRAVADLPKVCENVNLPFQAGDDEVLERMRRGYTRGEYLEKIDEIRELLPEASLTTDLIVGFSDESDEAFERTLDVLEEVRFDKVHSAMYSVRPGTIAERKLPDTVTREEKKRRLHLVQEVQERIQTEINAGLAGGEFDVLVDSDRQGRASGRTRTDKLVYIAGNQPAPGDTVRAKITETSPWSLQGAVVQPQHAEVLTA